MTFHQIVIRFSNQKNNAFDHCPVFATMQSDVALHSPLFYHLVPITRHHQMLICELKYACAIVRDLISTVKGLTHSHTMTHFGAPGNQAF